MIGLIEGKGSSTNKGWATMEFIKKKMGIEYFSPVVTTLHFQ